MGRTFAGMARSPHALREKQFMLAAGTDGNDTLVGTADGDQLYGLGGDDSLSGLDGADQLQGDAGADTLEGGADNDIHYPGSGGDVVRGGAGQDIVSYDDVTRPDLAGAPTQGLTLDLVHGTVLDGWGGHDVLFGIESAAGGSLADLLQGNGGANSLAGAAGDDTLAGSGGNDVLYGEAGDDRMDGGDGADTMYGDLGADRVRGGAGSDALFGGGGDDTLAGGAGNEPYLYPGSGNDLVDGGLGIDTVRYDNGWGADVLGPATHAVRIDLARGTASDPWGGQDTLRGIESASGNVLDDVLHGNALANQLDGDAGNDLLRGGRGDDNLHGDAGNDTLLGGEGGEYIGPGSGDDAVDGGAGFDLVFYDDTYGGDIAGQHTQGVLADLRDGTVTDGWGGHDVLRNIEYVAGGTRADTLIGGDERIYLYGRGGDDSITGGSADDVVIGETGNDTLSGGDGDDLVVGVEGDDSLSGDAGNDALHGDIGEDTLGGGDGDDTLFPGSGDDVVDGGAGFDRLSFDPGYAADRAGPPSQGLVVDLAAGTVTDPWGFHDAISGIENIVGTGLDDVLIGDAGDNDLEGGGGSDEILGGAGADTASYHGAGSGVRVDLAELAAQETGGAGVDTLADIENLHGSAYSDELSGDAGANVLDGGAGVDVMSGGEGDDTYYVDDATDEVIELASEPGPVAVRGLLSSPDTNPEAGSGGNIDTVIAQVSYTLRANVENLQIAGTAALDGTGNALDNLMTGNSAANALSGLGGEDILDGAGGSDTLDGGDGNDTVGGGAGGDELRGGAGNDVLLGGAGADAFQFDAALSGSTNVDTVRDFTPGTDRIRLDDDVFTVFDATVSAALDPDAFYASAGSTAHDADDRILYHTGTGGLFYDPDGTGAAPAVRFAVLAGAPGTVSAGDFMVVG